MIILRPLEFESPCSAGQEGQEALRAGWLPFLSHARRSLFPHPPKLAPPKLSGYSCHCEQQRLFTRHRLYTVEKLRVFSPKYQEEGVSGGKSLVWGQNALKLGGLSLKHQLVRAHRTGSSGKPCEASSSERLGGGCHSESQTRCSPNCQVYPPTTTTTNLAACGFRLLGLGFSTDMLVAAT